MGGELIAFELVGSVVLSNNVTATSLRLTRRGLFGTMHSQLSMVQVLNFYKRLPQNDSCTSTAWQPTACKGTANSFTFIARWSSMSLTTSTPGVEVNLNISGFGFDTQREHYANFSSDSDWVVSASVYPASPTRFMVALPMWKVGSTFTRVYVYSIAPAICSMDISNASNSSNASACSSQAERICRTGLLDDCEQAPLQTYTFTAAWYSISAAPARVIFPVKLVIKGVAFHAGSGGYTCRYRPVALGANSDFYFDTTAVILNMTTLECETPTWKYKTLTYGALSVSTMETPFTMVVRHRRITFSSRMGGVRMSLHLARER